MSFDDESAETIRLRVLAHKARRDYITGVSAFHEALSVALVTVEEQPAEERTIDRLLDVLSTAVQVIGGRLSDDERKQFDKTVDYFRQTLDLYRNQIP